MRYNIRSIIALIPDLDGDDDAEVWKCEGGGKLCEGWMGRRLALHSVESTPQTIQYNTIQFFLIPSLIIIITGSVDFDSQYSSHCM